MTRIDVPFVELTAFFVKASFAMGLAFLLTSWLWVIVGTGVAGLGAGLLVLAGVPGWFQGPAPTAPPTPIVMASPSPEPPAIVVLSPPTVVAAPEPPPAPAEPVAEEVGATASDRAATEAAQRAEIERMRRERARKGP